MKIIYYRILGVIILIICALILFLYKFENDVLDFFTGILVAVGIALTFGFLPKKK